MGTIFVAGVYGVGKSTLCSALSDAIGIPAYSAGDLISNINGEKYGVNKAVQNKEANQDILAAEVKKKLNQYPTILLAGHFCIFSKTNCVERLPNSIFERLSMERILLLEADPTRILSNLNARDNKLYKRSEIESLLKEERQAAEDVSRLCSCDLITYQMTFDNTDILRCCEILNTEV